MSGAACRTCGCTETSACWPTCSWVEPDLCSQCHESLVHAAAPALFDQVTPMRVLVPHPHRARTRDQRAAETLRESLRTLGQYKPVIARELGEVAGTTVLEVLAGHGIVEQAAELGWNAVAVVVHHDVDDATAAQIVAVDNRASDLGGYDQVALAQLLALLPDLDAAGYTVDDRAEIDALAALATREQPLTDPDEVPDLPATPVSRVGDVWTLGGHRLVVGDGTSADVVALALGGTEADLLLTDPPYNVAYEGGTADALTIANDDMDPGAFLAFLVDLFTAAAENMRPGAAAYVFHADSEGAAFRTAFGFAGLDLKQVLVWVKDQFVLGRQDHQWQHEPILYGWKPGAGHDWYGGRTLTTVLDDERPAEAWSKDELVDLVRAIRAECSTVIRADRPRRNDVHPTMKPVALLAELIERSSRPGGRVLDVCAGSGATLIACEQAGRQASVVELDPRYADVIVRRWQKHTGLDAVTRVDDVVTATFDEVGVAGRPGEAVPA